ncbi:MULTISPECIES: hypothetical protein [Aphanothece]|uniref:hypothetical protein n=1 Tax=Aphanothece TaxID=1121 RepID=UPI00398469FF
MRSDLEDRDIRTRQAEALMKLASWQYWNRDGSPNHPGAHLLSIHAVEKVQPDRAVKAAERLLGHIDVRLACQHKAITAYEHAVHAEEAYIREDRPA